MPSKRSQRLEKEEEKRGGFYKVGRGFYKGVSFLERYYILYGGMFVAGYYASDAVEGVWEKIALGVCGAGLGGALKKGIGYFSGRRKKRREEEERRKQDWVRNQMYRKERERMIAQHEEEMAKLEEVKTEMGQMVKYGQDENAKLLAELMREREEGYRRQDKIEDLEEEMGDLQRRNQELEAENTDIAQLLQRRRDKDAGG